MADENNRLANMGTLMKNKQSRVVVILTVGVVGSALLVASMTTNNQQSRPKELAPQVNTPSTPGLKPTPGTSDNPIHNANIREDNRRTAEEAARTGESAVPRLTQPKGDREKDPFDLVGKTPDASTGRPDPSVPQPRPTAPAPAPAPVAQTPAPAPVPQQPKPPERVASEQAMAQAMAGLLNSWIPVPQKVEIEYTPGKSGGAGGAASAQMGPGVSQSMAVAAGAPTSATPAEPGAAAKKVAIKAGTIMHAVVLTSVNSDEPGPVLAQITSGPYAGGRLIGKFETSKDGEKLLLTFSTLTMQSADRSYQLSAYAVDPQTSRTAVASEVDNHYLSRYGSFIGATFLKGYSQALTQSGTTQTVSAGAAGVTATTTYPKLNNKEIAISALGTVGGEVAGNLKDGLKRPPTVTLNSGVEIGILVMQDTSF